MMKTKSKPQARLSEGFFGRLSLWLAGACASLTALTCAAANRTWTGNSGIDQNWMTPGNWQGGVAPSPGDSLIFQGIAMGGSTTNNNNFPDGTMFGSITIATAELQDFAIGGNRVVLTNGMAETAGGTSITQQGSYVYFDITLSGSQSVTASHLLVFNDIIDTDGYSLTLDNTGSVVISGILINNSGSEPDGFSLAKTNTGTATISSTGDISIVEPFDVELEGGPLVVDGAASHAQFYIPNGSLVVNGTVGGVEPVGSGVDISGTGFIGLIFQYIGDGTNIVTPGDDGQPGIMQCSTFFNDSASIYNSPDILQIIVNGNTPGTGYSQLLATVTYDLLPPVLSHSLSGLAVQWNYTPQMGDSFLVVTQAVPALYSVTNYGFFAGLPPDSIDDVTNGATLGISYNSNGVALTTLRTTNSPFVLWKGSVAADLSSYQSRNWSSTNNWAQGAGPTTGDVVVFSQYQMTCYTSNLTLISVPPMTNDLAGDTTLAALEFTGTNYTVYGNPLTITGGITNNTAAGTNFCYLDIATVGSLGLDVEPGGSLLMDGVIAGSGTINKTGAGLLIYTGTTMDAYLGTVAVNNGTLEVDGSFTDGSFTVNGGMLDGTGTVSAVTMTGGTLKPGDSPGILQVDGDLAMAPGAAFEAELDDPIPGSGYDQLRVNGSVNLNGATLNLQPNFAADTGAAFLILVNNGTAPIIGTFAGLPEGAIFQAGGQYFSISYQAGSGSKNVVVTRISPPGNLTGILSLPPTAVQLLGTGATNATYTVLANTNLASTNWINIGTVTPNSSGLFFFNDSNVLLFPQRFYQIQ